MSNAMEKIGSQFKVPGNIVVLIILALSPFIKSGMVSWAQIELKPIIKEEVVVQVEVAVDSLNIKQEVMIIEQRTQKAQMDTLKIWIKDLKETADSTEKLTKEDFEQIFRAVLEEKSP